MKVWERIIEGGVWKELLKDLLRNKANEPHNEGMGKNY